MKTGIYPKFRTEEIIEPSLLNSRKWFEFQARAFDLGKKTRRKMIEGIAKGYKRAGRTGRLASAIKFYPEKGVKATMGRIAWGVGKISVLNTQAKYWYVVNFGRHYKTGQPYIPNYGRFVPGQFTDGAPKAGGGNARFNYNSSSKSGIFPRKSIRPMNFIQTAQTYFNISLRQLLARIRTMK